MARVPRGTGGGFGVDSIRHFNGNLFADSTVLELTPGEMASRSTAAATPAAGRSRQARVRLVGLADDGGPGFPVTGCANWQATRRAPSSLRSVSARVRTRSAYAGSPRPPPDGDVQRRTACRLPAQSDLVVRHYGSDG